MLFNWNFILILLFHFGNLGQVNTGPKKHVLLLESSKDFSPLVISDSFTIDNSIMASFEWIAELDIELIELIKQHPCLYNKNDELFNVPLKRNSSLEEIGKILGCGKFHFLLSKVFILLNNSVCLSHLEEGLNNLKIDS